MPPEFEVTKTRLSDASIKIVPPVTQLTPGSTVVDVRGTAIVRIKTTITIGSRTTTEEGSVTEGFTIKVGERPPASITVEGGIMRWRFRGRVASLGPQRITATLSGTVEESDMKVRLRDLEVLTARTRTRGVSRSHSIDIVLR
jgi:hypothetical protein